MKEKCPLGKCESRGYRCKFYQPFHYKDRVKGTEKIIRKCGFIVLFEAIPQVAGSIDGLQQGVNEARNRTMETKAGVETFLSGMHQTLKSLGRAMNQITNRRGDAKRIRNDAH